MIREHTPAAVARATGMSTASLRQLRYECSLTDGERLGRSVMRNTIEVSHIAIAHLMIRAGVSRCAALKVVADLSGRIDALTMALTHMGDASPAWLSINVAAEKPVAMFSSAPPSAEYTVVIDLPQVIKGVLRRLYEPHSKPKSPRPSARRGLLRAEPVAMCAA